MTDRYYGVSVGGDRKTDVSTGSSTNSTVFEFRATTSDAGATRLNALKALEAIEELIFNDANLK